MGVRHRGVSQSVSQSVSNLFSAPDESVQGVILEYLRVYILWVRERGVTCLARRMSPSRS